MNKKEIIKKLNVDNKKDKEKVLEKITFCHFADDWDFENYFKLDVIKESEFFCLISFLYQQDCFLMILDIMNRYQERFLFLDSVSLDEIDFSERFYLRLERLENFLKNQYR